MSVVVVVVVADIVDGVDGGRVLASVGLDECAAR